MGRRLLQTRHPHVAGVERGQGVMVVGVVIMVTIAGEGRGGQRQGPAAGLGK